MDITDARTVRAISAQVAATALSRAPDSHTYQNPPTADEVVAFAKRIDDYISGRR